MIMSAVYADILSRAGEGYANYTDRAREMFWRALAAIIKSGDFAQQEAEGITQRIDLEQAITSFPVTITSLDAGYEVFGYVVQVTPLIPSNTLFTYKQPEEFPLAAHGLSLLSLTGVREAIWTVEYPNVKLTYNRNDTVMASATCNVRVVMHGVSSGAMTSAGDTASSESYVAYSLLIKAIEMATQLLIQELRG